MSAIVIGAGVGGLACAARLAAAGHRVTVLEQAPVVGGKLGLLERDGHRFDTGPSLLTLPWTLGDTLRATGVDIDDVLDLQRLDPIARYRFADGSTLDASADEQTFLTGLDAAFGAGSGVQWSALMQRAERIWDASAGPVLQSALRGPQDLLPLAANPRDLAAVAPHRSLRSLGREYLSDPRLRMLLDRYATYSGSDPRRAPAALVTVAYAERRWGGWYVAGGLRRIALVLAARVTALGGVIRTGVRVAQVEIAGGRVTGVRLAGGERLGADVVVANADAATVADRLLPRPDSASLRRRLRWAPRSLSGFVMLLGVDRSALRGDAAAMPGHTVLFPADYDAEFDGLFGAQPRYVTDPTIYVSVPRDPAVAPEGRESWFVLVNAPRTDQVAAPPTGYSDRVLQLMAQRGVDVRDAVRLRVERTPADLQRDTLTPGGAIYGTSSNGPLAAFLRPPNIGPVEGLYLVGGSSHPGGGLPMVLLSAAIVADALAPLTHRPSRPVTATH
ncbi:phytoene desaturase family protein [soil metagenome]